MRITHRIAAALVAILVVLTIGATFILDAAVRSGFERLEQSVHERNQARVDANMQSLGDDLRSRVTDYAYWDDTHAFLNGGPGDAYTRDLTNEWLSDYGIDAVVFVGARGRVLWSRVVLADGAVATDSTLAERLNAYVSSRANGRAARSGVIWTPDLGFLMVSFAQATRSDGSGAPTGWVIMAQRITAAALSEQTQMRIELVSRQTPSPYSQRVQQLRNGGAQVWRTPETLYALNPIRDPFGETIGAIVTQQPRQAMQLGNQAIAITLAFLVLTLAIALVALWFLLRTLVIKRLERLEAHFHAQTEDLREMPAPAAPTKDEITNLTIAYNRLIERLREAHAREQAALVQREAEATANRMKSDFLANVSHELRRPLDAIIGYTELIGEELQGADAERSRADLERVTDSARRLLTLIGEILDISRIEAAQLELRPESFQVAAFARSFEDTGVRVEVSGELGAAYTDRRRLHQCVAAALDNLRQASPRSTITLRARGEGLHMRFELHAEDAALDASQLEPTQNPFAVAAKPDFRIVGGLALLVAQRLLPMLGGTLTARNENSGATMILTALVVLDDAGQRAQREVRADAA